MIKQRFLPTLWLNKNAYKQISSVKLNCCSFKPSLYGMPLVVHFVLQLEKVIEKVKRFSGQ